MIDLPTDFTPSTTQFQPFFIPSPLFDIRFLPQLNPSEKRFCPNTFVEVSQEAVQAKVNALSVYENVIRPVPHPRSKEALMALPVLRGAQSGVPLAEAFECVFRKAADL